MKTLEVTESEVRDDPLTRLISPLAERTVAAGIHPQPPGHIDDLGTVELRVRGEAKDD